MLERLFFALGLAVMSSGTQASTCHQEYSWAHEAIGALRVWDKDCDGVIDPGAPAGQGVIVSVLDTGVDYRHPDLGSGYLGGWDFGDGDADPMDMWWHGTAMAGLLAGSVDGQGTAGIAPLAGFYSLKVMGGEDFEQAVASAIRWSVEHGVSILSMSLGWAIDHPVINEAIREAYAAGVLFVTASGNDGQPIHDYPSLLPEVISVGGVNSRLEWASFSNYGSKLELVAPATTLLMDMPIGMGRKGKGKVLNAEFTNPVEFYPLFGTQPTPSEGVQGEVVDANRGSPEDFSKIDAKGKVALFKNEGWEEISLWDRIDAASSAGAVAALIVNPNIDDAIKSFNKKKIKFERESFTDIPAFEITAKDARAMLEFQRSHPLEVALESQSSDAWLLADGGTSVASPIVAGVAALVKSANPKLSQVQIRKILQASARDLGHPGDPKYGYGLVDAEAAVRMALE